MQKYTLELSSAAHLAKWYDENKREMPWRDTGDPYDVWLSEIMLQQTRIEAAREKFLRFREALPGIAELAACDEDHLMKLWEGLGYYSRAKNLQKCAQVIMRDHGGTLPADPELLRRLPGIGPYTAGAIASIAFGIAVPAVDGNVMRVLSRFLCIREDVREPETKGIFEDIIRDLFRQDPSPAFAASFNQGLMELGETLCLPNGAPLCEKCPWKAGCIAHAQGFTDSLPVRGAAKKRREIERTLLILRCGNAFLLRKRPEKGLLAGLYEFPGIDGRLTREEALQAAETIGAKPTGIHPLPEAKHIFTHLEWHMTAWEIETGLPDHTGDKDTVLASKEELARMAIPSAFRTYIEYYALQP